MKAVVFYKDSSASMEQIMQVYPRHKQFLQAYVDRGEVLGIGPFGDGGSMGIFKDRTAAEAFIKGDPFVVEGLAGTVVIREWKDDLL